MEDENEVENEILATIDIKTPGRCVFSLYDNDESMKMTFGESVITLETYHNQDCCEHVYLDFSAMKYYVSQFTDEYKSIKIKGIRGDGILLCFVPKCEYTDLEDKVFIPGYNSQNGYYSDELEIVITNGNTTARIDLDKYKQDDIC